MAKVIPLVNTQSGIISITKLQNPYGEGTTPVISIGISLNGDENNLDWKVHIPLENLDDVIKSLQEIKEN